MFNGICVRSYMSNTQQECERDHCIHENEEFEIILLVCIRTLIKRQSTQSKYNKCKHK